MGLINSNKADRINSAMDMIEKLMSEYETLEAAKEKEIEEFQEEESNVINIEDVFSEYEREGKDVRET
jgi:predicted  nucleic acid-binding Zn-ribbon protein